MGSQRENSNGKMYPYPLFAIAVFPFASHFNSSFFLAWPGPARTAMRVRARVSHRRVRPGLTVACKRCAALQGDTGVSSAQGNG